VLAAELDLVGRRHDVEAEGAAEAPDT
jgi:hypothetical protein